MGPGGGGGSSSNSLFYDDYEAISNQVTGLAGISPSYQSSYPIKYNSESLFVSVKGIKPEYFQVNSTEIETGRELLASDDSSQARVVILGPQTADDLFGRVNPIGKAIKINGVRFEVIGVLTSKGGSIQNSDEIALIPLETGYVKLFGSSATKDGHKLLSTISLSASSAEVVDSVMAQTERVLRREHNLKLADDADFSVMSQSDFLSTLNTVTTTLKIFLGAIAGISLLVGGIGIMNIMLVSVTERTREIGLRKAVGARKDQILLQFLIETMTLSVLGGIIGIGFGAGIAGLVTLANLITAQITISSILLSILLCCSSGFILWDLSSLSSSQSTPDRSIKVRINLRLKHILGRFTQKPC